MSTNKNDLNNSMIYDPSDTTVFESRSLIHRTIVDIHNATDTEMFIEGWALGADRPCVIVLDDGTKIYASRDETGTGPGVLFLLLPEHHSESEKSWHKQRVIAETIK